MSMEFTKEYTQEDEDYGHMEVECDDCGDTDSEDGSFRECIKLLRERGWEFKYHGKQDFTHHCPNLGCKRKRAGTMPRKTKGQERRERGRGREHKQKATRKPRRRRRSHENK